MDTSRTIPAVQRRLVLMRHAKAVEDDVTGDHARVLSARGREDATGLGEWLRAQEFPAAQIYCSTATRTRQTLELLDSRAPVILSDKLYLATTGDMFHLAQQADDANETLILIGHNPGMHGLLAYLTGTCANEADEDRMLLKFPTAAAAVLTFNLPHWAGLTPRSGQLDVLRFPA